MKGLYQGQVVDIERTSWGRDWYVRLDDGRSVVKDGYIIPLSDADFIKIPAAQLAVAHRLACRYGHEWGGTVNEGESLSRAEIMARVQMARSDDWQPHEAGISAPSLDDANIVHMTMTGRLTWEVTPNGTAHLSIYRPIGCVLWAICYEDIPLVDAENRPFHERHVDALHCALMAVYGPLWYSAHETQAYLAAEEQARQRVDAWLAPFVEQALPDEVAA